VTALPSIILSWISSSLCLTWYKALSTSFLVSILLIRALTFFLPISSILLFKSSILDLDIKIASLSSGMAFFIEISTMDLSNLIWISILEFALNILASFSIFKALLKSKSFSILSLSPFFFFLSASFSASSPICLLNIILKISCLWFTVSCKLAPCPLSCSFSRIKKSISFFITDSFLAKILILLAVVCWSFSICFL